MLVVQKYGGTSVANTDRIASVAAKLSEQHSSGDKIVVVVSALAGETDRLLALTNQVTSDVSERERDIVVSTGEQVSAGLLALALKERGVPAVTLLSFQIPIVTDGVYGRSKINAVAADRLLGLIEKGNVVIVPGFQGISPAGEITTLGRGGSDTTAVAIAVAVKADCCEIYSDVDGVYSSDPNVCGGAQKIKKLTYDEMLEIAGAGAKIVQMRAVELAAKFDLPLHIRSSFENVEGTRVANGAANNGEMGNRVVSAITHTLGEAKVSVRKVPNRTGLAAKLFEPLSKSNINVDMIVQNISEDNKTDLSFTVDKHDFKKALALTERSAAKIGAGRVEAAGDVSKISIIGVGMRSHAGVAAQMFETLANEGVDIQLISTSEIKVSVVIDMKFTELAVRSLHKAFALG
jgi:aspartate kinase